MSRLLHLYRRYYPDEGGIESTMRAFCEYACGLGNEVTALVSSPRPWSQRRQYHGVNVVRAASVGTFANTPICPGMPAWINRLKPDLVEIHHAYPYGMWALQHSRFKGPLIVHYHFDISRFGTLQQLIAPVLQRTLARADRIFVNSQSYAESSSMLEDHLDKCVYIPAGVAPARFALMPHVEEKAAQLRREDRFRVLFVGRLSHYKGLEHLVAAMQQVDGELNIVGRGKIALTLEQLAAMLNISERVHLLGRLPEADLLAQYHAADVVVLPSVSRGESFGVTQVEAMLCGRPVICSDLPGVRDVGSADSTRLVPPGDVAALAEALNRLKDDADLRRRMGEAGRQRALAEYDVETLNTRRWQVYQELLGIQGEGVADGAG
jgi:glycosyltransferase involved in cell wall biosynthesis